MKHWWYVPILLLAAVMACGPSQNAIQTAIAPTQAGQATAAASTLTAGALASTPTLADTPQPTDTVPPTWTPKPANTKRPAKSPTPTATQTAIAPTVATATPTRTRVPGPPPPNFLDTVVKVKRQVENFGGQIDIAASSGFIDCQEIVNSYEYVAARASLKNVPASLAGAYQLYSSGVALFISKAADLYQNCKNFLANPSGGGGVPALQWTVARTAVNDAGDLLRQAIIAAGGTP